MRFGDVLMEPSVFKPRLDFLGVLVHHVVGLLTPDIYNRLMNFSFGDNISIPILVTGSFN